MKKYIPYMLAGVVGLVLSFLLIINTKNDEMLVSNEVQSVEVSALQIGVFKNYSNASSMKESIGGIVVEDNDLYRVYYSILNDKDNIDYMTKFLDKEGISYYIRTFYTPLDTYSKTGKVEELMKNNKDENEKLKMNKELLEIYSGGLIKT